MTCRPMPERRPLAILLATGDHARMHAAFTLAAGAAAMDRPVLVFAMGDGCRALLATLDAAGEALLAGRGVATVAELRAAAVDLGARLVICETALRASGIDPGALLAGIAVEGVLAFLDAARDADTLTL